MIEDGINNSQPDFSILDPAPSLDSEPTTLPAPPSMEVVTVDDLLDRLTGGREEDIPAEEAEESSGSSDGYFPSVSLADDGSIKVVGMDSVLEYLEAIQETNAHPALTTPFEEYTVTEGLLLLLFLSVFSLVCAKLLKGGFSWLR